MKRNTLIAAIAAFSLGGAVAGAVWFTPRLVAQQTAAAPLHPDWKKSNGRFRRPVGQRQRFSLRSGGLRNGCGPLCRSKLGSCNCTTGVANDEDIDRMSDFELLGDKVSPLAEGRPVQVGWMKGRSAGSLADHFRNRSALSVVLNDHCDMLVATVVISEVDPAPLNPASSIF